MLCYALFPDPVALGAKEHHTRISIVELLNAHTSSVASDSGNESPHLSTSQGDSSAGHRSRIDRISGHVRTQPNSLSGRLLDPPHPDNTRDHSR
jgi:hypothetical protein